MDSMTNSIREAIKVYLTRKNIKQTDIAKRRGLKNSEVSNALNGWAYQMPRVWQEILEDQELRLVVVDKKGNILE